MCVATAAAATAARQLQAVPANCFGNCRLCLPTVHWLICVLKLPCNVNSNALQGCWRRNHLDSHPCQHLHAFVFLGPE